jgi:hypothetical protein
MPRTGRDRLHLDLALAPGGDRQAEVDRLVSLGATPVGPGHDEDAVTLADPDGTEFCLLPPR